MTVKNGDFIRIDYTEFVDGQAIATTVKDLAEEKGIFSEEIQYGHIWWWWEQASW